MKIVLIFAVLALLFIALLASIGYNKNSSSSSNNCVEKGIEYYKEIGSFPRLSDGREAANVVKERCGRSPVAFDGLD